MKLDAKTWTALRESVAADARETFEALVAAIAKQLVRDLLAARVAAHYQPDVRREYRGSFP